MKTKQIPALITLAAGFITCIIAFIYQVSLGNFLKTLFWVIIVFFVLGSVIKFVMDKNFPLEQNEIEEKKQEEEQSEQREQEEKEDESKPE